MNEVFENLKSFAEMQEEETNKNPVVDEVVESTDDVNEEVADETDEVESEDVESDEVDDKPTEQKQGEDTPWKKSGKVPKGILKRFQKYNERDRQKDQRIADLENAMQKFINASNEGKPQRDPTLQDFLEAGKSESDYINYMVEQRIQHNMHMEAQRRQQEDVLKRTQDDLNRKWNESYNRAKNDLPDYDIVMSNVDIQIPTTSMRYIAENDIGPYITYTIASNEDLQDKIDNAGTIADKHNIILEVEKNIRNWLSNRNKKVSTAGSQPQNKVSNSKPKIPGSSKGNKPSNRQLDPATASIEEWLGIN